MFRPSRALAWLAVAGCSLGCQLVLGFEELEPETAAAGAANQAGSGTGAAGAGGTDPDPCAGQEPPTTDGSAMTKLPRSDGTCFFMDEHEVTNAQYAAFAELEHDAPSADCSWNDQYLDAECQASARITTLDDHPVVCVDQCDAKAYCQWVGKELCRGDWTFSADETLDDWFSACSNRGETQFPYGNVSSDAGCNLQPASNETTWAVDVGVSCENGEGVRDLIGNVWEWVDACKTSQDADDDCQARGGSFIEQRQTCRDVLTRARGVTEDFLGFRCCAYPD